MTDIILVNANIARRTKDNNFTGINTFSDVTSFNGTRLAVRTVTDSTTITSNDDIIICNKATAMTVTLTAAIGTEQRLYIKNIGAGEVTIARAGSDTIDGETSQSILQWECIELVDRASANWSIL